MSYSCGVGVIALCFHQKNMPSNYDQFWMWVAKALPGGSEVYMLGLAAVCWAIWKTRNEMCFEKKRINNRNFFLGLCIYAVLGWSVPGGY
jgi:hypothetical protein